MSIVARIRRVRPVSAVLWSVVAALVGCAVYLARTPHPPEAVPPVPRKPAPVRVVEAVPTAAADRVVLPATVEPRAMVEVAAEKPARVEQVGPDVGSRVARGDLLVLLDARASTQIRERTALQLTDAERDLRRLRELQGAGALSESGLEAAQLRRDMAAVAAAEAAIGLSQCRVEAPLTGTVERRHVEPGEYVREGDTVYTLIDMDVVKLVVQVPERMVPHLASNQTVACTIDALPGLVLTAAVTFVARAADPASNAYRCELTTANPGGVLRAGMIGRAPLSTGTRSDAILLPLAAILPRKGEHVVFVARDGRAVRRVVAIEAIAGDRARIASGIEPGDRVIVDGNRTLVDGEEIAVQESTPPASAVGRAAGNGP